MITWKLLSVLLLLLLLLSVPIFSEVCLEDEEWAELEVIWTELETLLQEQGMELESVETRLAEVSQEIIGQKKSLSEAELSLKLQEKEQTKKTIAWAMGSLFFGYLIGTALK